MSASGAIPAGRNPIRNTSEPLTMKPFYDPDAPVTPDHPVGVSMVVADHRELTLFGANLAVYAARPAVRPYRVA